MTHVKFHLMIHILSSNNIIIIIIYIYFNFIFSICYSKHVFVYTFLFSCIIHTHTLHLYTRLYIKICIKGTNNFFSLFFLHIFYENINIIVMCRAILLFIKDTARHYMPLYSFNFVEFRV